MGGEREQGLEGKNARFKSTECIEKLLGFVLKTRLCGGGSVMLDVCSLSGGRHWDQDSGLHTLSPVRSVTS